MLVEYGSDLEGSAFAQAGVEDPLARSAWNLQVCGVGVGFVCVWCVYLYLVCTCVWCVYCMCVFVCAMWSVQHMLERSSSR